MSIMVTVKFPLQDGKAEAFLKVLGEALPDTRAYEGCVSVDTYAEESGDHVFLVEEWESKAHQQAYLKWRVETGLLDVIAPYVSGDAEFLFYEMRDE
jgi:quinol monooxygenase YgiN